MTVLPDSPGLARMRSAPAPTPTPRTATAPAADKASAERRLIGTLMTPKSALFDDLRSVQSLIIAGIRSCRARSSRQTPMPTMTASSMLLNSLSPPDQRQVMWRRKLEQTRLSEGWRLIVPLLAILLIVVIGGALLVASHVFERNRQEQQLISDALWAEQAVSYEVQRMLDGLRSLGRPADQKASVDPDWRIRMRSIMQRDPAIVSSYRVSEQSDRIEEYQPSGPTPVTVERILAAALRASRLRGPTCLDVSDHAAGVQEVLIAVPADSDGGEIVVAVVSLERLLQNAIPWWLAHNTRITLENAAGDVLAERESNVTGGGVYVRKIATPFIDRMFFLNANSTHGTPLLI